MSFESWNQFGPMLQSGICGDPQIVHFNISALD